MPYNLRETMGGMLKRVSEKFASNIAIIFENQIIKYNEFYDMVNRFACGLYKLGVRKGHKVAIWMPNLPEWVVAWWGIPTIGAVIVPIDHWYKPAEAQYILHHSDSIAVVTYETSGKWRFVDMLTEIEKDIPHLRYIIVGGNNPDTDLKKTSKAMGFNDLLSLGENWRNDREYLGYIEGIDPDDVSFILYTSGTTGKPKGVMLSHYQIIKNAYDQGEILRTNDSDKLIVQVPFSHCFGCVMSITLMANFGGAIVPLLAFDPERAMELIARHGCTMIHGVPTMFIRELEVYRKKKYDIKTLRTGIMAGAPCPIEVMSGVIEEMGCNVCITYGLTEASPGVTMTRLDDDIKDRVETVGRPLPEVEVKIVDDHGNEVPPGTVGELLCRGYNVMKGYYKMPEATKDAITKDGWLYTGDLAVMDERGFVKIVGRKKEMIIVGGFNVYPKEIEEYIYRHDKVHDVAVVGVADDELGEVVAAVVVPHDDSDLTPQEIVDYCYGQIASAKVPRYVYITKEMPLSGRGKVQKFKIVEILKEKIKNGEIKRIIPTKVKKRA